MAQNGNNLRGALTALACFGVFATHDVLVKLMGADYSAFQVVFFSVLLGFPIVTVVLMRDTTDGNLIPKHPWWTLARTVSVVITASCAFYAFGTLPLAQTYAILFASPLLITLLAIPMLGEKIGARRITAVIVGLIGVIVVLRPGQAALELGHFAAMTAAVTSSFASIIVRKIGQDERSAVLILYPMMGNFILLGCLMPFVYQPMPVGDFGILAVIAAMAYLGTLLLILAYRHGEAVIVAPMQYSQILWAAVYGYAFFGERLDVYTVVGAAIIILSGIYIVLREGDARASRTQPVLQSRSRPETGTRPEAAQVPERS